MRREQTIGGMRLRLLALVLALALIWYAMSPAPESMRSAKKVEEPPDEEWRETKAPAPASYGLEPIEEGIAHPYEPPVSVGEGGDADDLDWPDVIDL